LLPDLQALLRCLVNPVECPHCGRCSERIIGPIKSDGVFTCPACGRAAIIDASRINREVATAAERLSEQALDLGRSLQGGAPPDDDRPHPAGRADDESN
jgi:predicted RNA-binding Zn-ribbon protein involved in translation (DUF1610 family)